MKNLDYLVPQGQGPKDSWRWGTVISTSPTTVHLDNDPVGTYLPADASMGQPFAGDRVWCQLLGTGAAKRVVIVGAESLRGRWNNVLTESALPSAWPKGTTLSEGGGAANRWPTNPYSVITTNRFDGSRTTQTLQPKNDVSPVLYRSSTDDSTWTAWRIMASTTDPEGLAMPGTASFTQYDDATLPSGWPTGITVGNTGGDTGWPATYASLYVFHADNGARVVQMVIKSAASASTPTLMWVRSSASSSTWGDWASIGGGNAGAWRSDHTYKSGYTTHGSYPVRFRRDGDFIYMAGLLARSSSNWGVNATDSAVVTLPADSRPDRSDFYAGASNENENESCTFVVTTGGTIDIRTGAMGSVGYTAAYFSMNNIIFYSPAA